MRDLNIHWQGYPHYHLPRIRVASSRTASIQSRNTVRVTAYRTLRNPLATASDHEHKPRGSRITFRRGRARSVGKSSAVVRSRRRASQRAKHNLQIFGWDTPTAELASKVTTDHIGLNAPSAQDKAGIRSRSPLYSQVTSESIIPSTDGAGNSVTGRGIGPKQQRDHSSPLPHVAEVPVYWGNINKASQNPDLLSARSGRQHGAYSRVRQAETLNRQRKNSVALPPGRSRTYDTRIDPKSLARSRTTTYPTRIQLSGPAVPAFESPPYSPERKTRQSFGSKAFWEAVNTSELRAKESDYTASAKPIVQTDFSTADSRTSSQKRAVGKFTKELELYLQATRSLPKQSLVASPSETTVSACTITELGPYQAEFQSAGLAVSSREQRGIRFQKTPSPPPTPPKDKMWQKRSSSPGKSKLVSKQDVEQAKPTLEKKREPSFASGSTGTMLIGFTPPHEKSYPRRQEVKAPSVASSDGTVIGFTPPYEMNGRPPVIPALLTPQTPSKKSLPWLRRPQTSLSSPTEKKLSTTSAVTDKLNGWVSTGDAEVSEASGSAPQVRKSYPTEYRKFPKRFPIHHS